MKIPNEHKHIIPDAPNLKRLNVGALIIRIGFWAPLYYHYKKEPSK